MAKKKASVKKAKVSKTGKKVRSPKAKKIVKKTVGKGKSTVEKAVAKKPAAKKTNKEAVAKKTPAKKIAKKATKVVEKASSAKKAAPKKSAPKKSPIKKAVAKKSSTPKSTKAKAASVGSSYSAPVLKAAPKKKLDFSQFVTPLDDRIFIQPEAVEKMTPGGLYIPDTVSDVSGNLQGYVVAVGRGHQNKKGQVRPMDVQVGDKVIFNEFSGSRITIQNEDLVILREIEVMGVVSK